MLDVDTPVDWLWEIVEARSPDQLAALWPNPEKAAALLVQARRENLRDGLNPVLDGFEESPVLHDPALAKVRRAILALILSALRA
jgi:hypothetical protein